MIYNGEFSPKILRNKGYGFNLFLNHWHGTLKRLGFMSPKSDFLSETWLVLYSSITVNVATQKCLSVSFSPMDLVRQCRKFGSTQEPQYNALFWVQVGLQRCKWGSVVRYFKLRQFPILLPVFLAQKLRVSKC